MGAKWTVVLAAGVVMAAVSGVILWRFAFFVVPYTWTREPSQLGDVLSLRTGDRVADIGAGNGALAVAMARVVGPSGIVYATEISPERREDIARRSAQAGTSHLLLVEAAADRTNLPEACCQAIYMRAVFHHIPDQPAFARAVSTAVRPGGKVAIIDFAPGTLWFHGDDHGVTPQAVVEAFQRAGLSLARHIDDWGGGMFLLLFERRAV